MKFTKLDYLKAHQYLYYIKCSPVLTDYEYDIWGRYNCADDYKNGSDREDDYTDMQKELALAIRKREIEPLPQTDI